MSCLLTENNFTPPEVITASTDQNKEGATSKPTPKLRLTEPLLGRYSYRNPETFEGETLIKVDPQMALKQEGYDLSKLRTYPVQKSKESATLHHFRRFDKYVLVYFITYISLCKKSHFRKLLSENNPS